MIVTIWDTQEDARTLLPSAENIARLRAKFGSQPEELVDF